MQDYRYDSVSNTMIEVEDRYDSDSDSDSEDGMQLPFIDYAMMSPNEKGKWCLHIIEHCNEMIRRIDENLPTSSHNREYWEEQRRKWNKELLKAISLQISDLQTDVEKLKHRTATTRIRQRVRALERARRPRRHFMRRSPQTPAYFLRKH